MRRVLMAGGSMSPTIEIGDLVHVQDLDGRCKPGDVVVLSGGPSAQPLCHRVLLVVPSYRDAVIVHRGDADGAQMALVRARAVMGRAIAVERAGIAAPLLRRPPSRSDTARAAALVARRAFRRALRPLVGLWAKHVEAEIEGLAAQRRAALGSASEAAAAYDSGAEGWDDRFAADSGRVSRYVVLDDALIETTHGARRVLDLGCGTGRLLAKLEGGTKVGIDVSAGMLKVALRRGHLVIRADAHSLPFADGSFDAITAGCAVFIHLDYERALAECARVLTPRGMAGIHLLSGATMGVRPSTWGQRYSSGAELRLNAVAEITQPAQKVGLKLLKGHGFRSLGRSGRFVRAPFALGPRAWAHCVVVLARGSPPLPRTRLAKD